MNPIGSIVGGLIGANKQKDTSMELAKYQADRNEAYMDRMNAYNTPANQMARFKDAGLNPHLIYGQGSPGNQSSPLTYPDVKTPDFQSMFAQFGPLLNQTALTSAQVNATNAKTEQTYAVTAIKKVEEQVLRRNPLLNDPAFLAIIDGLLATADLKRGQLKLQGIEQFYQEASVGLRAAKIEKELELLDQRFKLGESDQAIKAEILKGKEFQNAILEVQKRFLADGEVGSQQLLQFVQLLLMKIL